MSLGQAYATPVPPNTWTLVCQSLPGDGIRAYQGILASAPVSAKFRSYLSNSYHNGADPSDGEFRHSYVTSPSDRICFCADAKEVYPVGTVIFLEVYHEFTASVNVDGTILGI